MGIGRDIGNSIIGSTAPAILKIYETSHDDSSGKGKEALSGVLAGGVVGQVSQNNEKIFKVQFNPAKLKLFAEMVSEPSGQASVEQKPEESPKAVSEEFLKPILELSFSLVFDKVVNQDAFYADKLLFTPSAAAGNIITLDTLNKQRQEKTSHEYSVQPEVEGLIAALYNRYTRTVRFQWGDFSFEGVITEIRAQYTMFSLSGRPIRAIVEMGLMHDEALKMTDQWKKDFDSAFGGKGADLTTAAQSVGTFFNI